MSEGIAVVGGGPAGLAAAWALSRGGRVVRLYESAPRPGGALRTERLAGVEADSVVQLLSGSYRETRSLLDDLGLGDRLVPVPGRDALWRNGGAHAVRYGSITSMVASRALPAGLKLRMGLRYVPFLERHRELSLSDPAAAGPALDRESIADWGRRELGEDFVELLAHPLLAAYYGVEPEETSAAFFHGLARTGLGVEVLGARGGMGALAADVAAALSGRGVEIRTGARVDRIETADHGVRVGVAGGGVAEHEAVVVAVPPAVAAELVPGTVADGVRTRATAVLVLALPRPLSTGWFGLSIPRTEPPGDVLAAVCVQEEKGTVASGEGGALVLVPAPARGPRWAVEPADRVLAEALPALERVLPGVGGEVSEAKRVRVPHGVWLPEPGHFTRLAEGAPGQPHPRVALAGAYLVSPTVEGAVRSGIAAAARLSGGGA